ncbi:hypothetical protein DCD74_10475 [Lysobacter oculi]|uniref:ApeI dehydratase-like domain-containing protein n=1 Tax=Solilutibacter oculi TaxID=2698682 RepID=A0A344J7P0_9GAMM|nr:hypothetical protein [Lysobacter oculi]AXA85050.1 hypothetical protein DCD74_10475 [Lysobacter oculi]
MSEAASTRTPLCIPATHPSLPGHFPGQPVVPGVVILDAVQRAIEADAGPLPAFKLPQVKFLQPLLPDEDAVIEIDATAPSRWRFRVLRGDTLIASGEIAAA